MFDTFISYRRSDSRADAGRLYDRLSAHFGDASVFMDIDDIEAGQDFVAALERSLDHCDAMLVVIGRHWLDQADSSGQRRLDNEKDFVRVEIQRAINRGIRIIPVLVGGAQMPDDRSLPGALATLLRFQAHEISDSNFHQGVDRLIETLEHAGGKESRTKRKRVGASLPVAAVLGVVISVVIAFGYWQKTQKADEAVALNADIGDQYVVAGDFGAASDAYRVAVGLDDKNVDLWRKVVAAKREQLLRRAFDGSRPVSLGPVRTHRTQSPIDDADKKSVLDDIYTLRALDRRLASDMDLLLDEALVYKASVSEAGAALPVLLRAQALDASRPDVLAELGLLEVMLNDDAAGIERIRLATTLAPDNSLWRFYLAESLSEKHRCRYAGDDFDSAEAPQACAQVLRDYHRAWDLAGADEHWARHVRHFAAVGAMSIFHAYANREPDMLTNKLDMPLVDRISEIEFLRPLETRKFRSGWHDYPEYWLATLYDAVGQSDKAAALIKSLLDEKGERTIGWLTLYEKILRRPGGDLEELARVQALIDSVRN